MLDSVGGAMLKGAEHGGQPKGRHCAVYFFEGWIGVAPTVIGLAEVLIQTGYQVTIYCRRTAYAPTGDLGAGIRVRYIDVSPAVLHRAPRLLKRLVEIAGFLRASRAAVSDKPSIHIGVDQVGGILAALAARNDGGAIVHLSLELDTRRNLRSRLVRRLFRTAYMKSVCCVVQDEGRFDALSDAVGYVHPRPFFVPNSPTGAAVRDDASNFFREILPLPVDRFPVLVVHAGMMDDISYAKELAGAFEQVDLGCALIFHERTPRDPDDHYIAEMRQRNRRNLFFSTRPVPFEMIDRVFAAASIGLAFYRPVDANLALMAKASGKMAFHLKHGTPMIMNDLPSMVELNERYDIGVTVHDPSDGREMRRAVEYCLENYSRLSANARRCFEQEFQLETKAAPFRQFVASHYPP